MRENCTLTAVLRITKFETVALGSTITHALPTPVSHVEVENLGAGEW